MLWCMCVANKNSHIHQTEHWTEPNWNKNQTVMTEYANWKTNSELRGEKKAFYYCYTRTGILNGTKEKNREKRK